MFCLSCKGSDPDIAEAIANGFEDWLHVALYAGAVELLATTAIDNVDPHAGRDDPDLVEVDHGVHDAPDQGQWETNDDGQQIVVEPLAGTEAAVGALPDTFERVAAVWLSQHVFKSNLKTVSVHYR